MGLPRRADKVWKGGSWNHSFQIEGALSIIVGGQVSVHEDSGDPRRFKGGAGRQSLQKGASIEGWRELGQSISLQGRRPFYWSR